MSIRSYGSATVYINHLFASSETVGAVQPVLWTLSASPTTLGGGGTSTKLTDCHKT